MEINLAALTGQFIPDYKTGHTRYVDYVKDSFRDGCRWLDAGGGHQVFHDESDGERQLIARAGMAVVCDLHVPSLARHISVTRRVKSDLAKIPFASNSFDFVTCGMVVEHLADPGAAIAELARVLAPGGKLIIHTVNLWGYPTLLSFASQIVPEAVRGWLVGAVTGRESDDVFPAYYRCNTDRAISKFAADAGLRIEEMRYMHSGMVFRALPPLWPIEIALMRLLCNPRLARLRAQLLMTATKQSETLH